MLPFEVVGFFVGSLDVSRLKLIRAVRLFRLSTPVTQGMTVSVRKTVLYSPVSSRIVWMYSGPHAVPNNAIVESSAWMLPKWLRPSASSNDPRQGFETTTEGRRLLLRSQNSAYTTPAMVPFTPQTPPTFIP